MLLYIANSTKQHQDFIYRLPGKGPRMQPIPIGGQIQVTGDLTADEIDQVIAQHAKYGLIPVDEVDRNKTFNGMCYSVGKSITMDKIDRAIRHNTNVLIERGKVIRQHAAIAEHNTLENRLVESERPEALRNLEMSVIEENHDPRSETPAISEGFRVNRDENIAPPPKNARRRKVA